MLESHRKNFGETKISADLARVVSDPDHMFEIMREKRVQQEAIENFFFQKRRAQTSVVRSMHLQRAQHAKTTCRYNKE